MIFQVNSALYALIPGSFKPPHKGHFCLIEYYSKLVGDKGTVNVYISNPSTKKQRLTALGNAIDANTVKKILEIYCKELKNVNFYISEISPVKDCYDFGENLENGTIIFGCSTKNDDIKRWNTVKKYYEERFPQIDVIEPSKFALEPSFNAISASDFRNIFGQKEKMVEFLPNHLSKKEKEIVLNLLIGDSHS